MSTLYTVHRLFLAGKYFVVCLLLLLFFLGGGIVFDIACHKSASYMILFQYVYASTVRFGCFQVALFLLVLSCISLVVQMFHW